MGRPGPPRTMTSGPDNRPVGGMSAPSMGHDGLHEYAEHARYRAVVAHDAGNADEVINRPISARLLADLQGKLPVTAPSSVRADRVDRRWVAKRTVMRRLQGVSRPGAAERCLRRGPASTPRRGEPVVPHPLLAWRPPRDVHSIAA